MLKSKKDKKNETCVIYSRVSTALQYYVPQTEELKRYTAYKGYKIPSGQDMGKNTLPGN